MEVADFSGYATKANIECTDGRTIMPDAFKHMDGQKVPLVWQHIHNDVNNVLGHAIFEARKDGLYAYCFFNQTPAGQAAKKLVHNGDVDSLSIYANKLVERAKQVYHGMIRELSLVISGANSGAKIDNVNIAHSDDPDDFTTLPEDVIIHFGLPIEFSDDTETNENDETDEGEGSELDHADGEKTFQDVYDTLNEEQENLLHFIVGEAVKKAVEEEPDAAHSDTTPDDNPTNSDDNEAVLAHQKGTNDMGTKTRNVFETSAGDEKKTISHSDVQAIFEDGKRRGSFMDAVHAFIEEKGLQHGITDIEILFPDAVAISNTPEWDKRRTEWVSGVLNKVHKTPFAKIKTLIADLTQDEARAKGYIKGNMKKQEWIGVSKRTTSPTTIYKKQQLDRDDMLDITDFDVVQWLMGEMRLMLEEELARAILIGDGRAVEDEDKVKDPLGASDGTGIRSIINDHEFYVTTLQVQLNDASSSYDEVIDAVMDGKEFYKGTGTPTFYTTIKQLNKFKKAKDTTGRRLYETNAAVAEALGVDAIVTVEPMNEVSGLIGIIVNLQDYNIGTNKGGELTSFEFFDIDYNQHKWLMETRLSGALTKPKTALVIMEAESGDVAVTPTVPTFVESTGVVTVVATTGVTYKNYATDATITAGAMSALAAGASIKIYAVANSGYFIPDTVADGPWTFKRPAA